MTREERSPKVPANAQPETLDLDPRTVTPPQTPANAGDPQCEPSAAGPGKDNAATPPLAQTLDLEPPTLTPPPGVRPKAVDEPKVEPAVAGPRLPARIGRFEVEAFLGEGAFGWRRRPTSGSPPPSTSPGCCEMALPTATCNAGTQKQWASTRPG